MNEIWKDIPGFEGSYQVSDLGRVRSLPRIVTRREKSGRVVEQPLRGRVLKDSVNNRGYRYVVLRLTGKSVTREIHTLVAAAFLGPRPNPEMQIRHLDGNPLNCDSENLCYGTRSENQLDTYSYRGRHHRLTERDAREILRRLAEGEKGRDLAQEFGVCESNISEIKHRRSFTWIT